MLGLWRDREVEVEVREILRHRGASDLSTAACKEWVRRLIRPLAPQWPRYPLRLEQAVLIGARFDELLYYVRADKKVEEALSPQTNCNS